MLIAHDQKKPQVHPEAYVAPDATVCGDVAIDAGARIMHGARIVAEGGRIEIGRDTIVMQNAVVRSTATHDCLIAENVLIGPTAHLVGTTVEKEAFLATGTSIFHGSRIGSRSVVRINAVVHVNTELSPKSVVPIGWVAVGKPAKLFSTDQDEELWAEQAPLKFTKTAYGVDVPLNECLAEVTEIVSNRLAGHKDDVVASN